MAFLVTKQKSAALRKSHLPKSIKLPDQLLFGLLFEGQSNYDEINSLIANHRPDFGSAIGQFALLKFIIEDRSSRSTFEERKSQLAQDIEDYLGSNSGTLADYFISYLGGAEFAIFILARDEQGDSIDGYRPQLVGLVAALKKQYGMELAVGLSPCSGVISAEVRRAYQSAGQAIRMGYGIWQRHYVYTIDDFDLIPAVYRGISADMIKKSRTIVTRLARHGDLLTTLSVFLKHDMNLTATAQALRVHRNTVLYRFSKIVELTDGLDPRNFDDAIQLRLAIVINQLQGF